ncbi:MAG: hypothetical protein V4692_13745 [Bdellovibrionota bacterium]
MRKLQHIQFFASKALLLREPHLLKSGNVSLSCALSGFLSGGYLNDSANDRQ